MNGLVAHTASYMMGTGSFSQTYSRWGVVLTTHPHLVLGLKKRVELYIFSPSGPSWLILG